MTKENTKQGASPAYLRIVQEIGDRIARGEYRPGDRLPSESEFCREFGVSPMTLRRALSILMERGLVFAEQGKGTFVRTLRLGEGTFTLQQLADQWQNESADVRLLQASTIKATGRVAEVLELAPGERAVYLRRLILKEETPIIYHIDYVRFDARRPLVETQVQITSLEGLLQAAGGESFPRGKLSVRAVNLSAEAARLLDQPEGAAAFCLEHLFEDYGGRPVSWGWFLCRADHFYLETRLGPEDFG
ncbi:MAG: GntR family transcriptional regulator [Thermoleophilia bacterium]